MGIQSFLKAQKGDPDWVFTPEQYFNKEFKIIDASLIELGQDKTDVVVLRQTPGEKDLLAKHLRIDVRENAKLDLIITNEAEDKLQQVFIYEIRVRDGGHINMGLFIKGGKLNKHIIQVTLDNGANFNAYGYALNSVKGDCEIITKVDHQGAYSVSNQYFVGEAGTGSQTVFQAIVNVEKEAKFAQIGIENSNLVVGTGGMCHGVPEVFNHSDSARISTGMNTDILDQDKTYYLQTRGLTHAQAEAMQLINHRKSVLNIVHSQEIKDEIEQLMIY